jgi:phage FluMu protein Com
MPQTLSHLRENTPPLVEQRCPVCKRILMATDALSGTVRVKCPRCGVLRDIHIEKKAS